MQYLGGKSNYGEQIVETIEPWREPGVHFVDVFCGALNVVRHAAPPRIAVDLCQPLITTLQATIHGWVPPDHVTEEEYQRIKHSPDPWDPLTAFAMFGCSYGGKWGGGYSRSKTKAHPEGRNHALMAKNGLLEKVPDCQGLDLFCLDYRDMPDPYPGLILYCDIPYKGTTPYQGVPPFDVDQFWVIADHWTSLGAFVSEGAGAEPPQNWIVFKEWSQYFRIKKGGARTERLYVHRESLMGHAKIMGLV